jgi:tRNA wybutosine-synthesizing protein 2
MDGNTTLKLTEAGRVKQKDGARISAAIKFWLSRLSLQQAGRDGLNVAIDADILLAQAPKRWVTYEPMILLPAGSFSSTLWQELLTGLDDSDVSDLWQHILEEISRRAKETLTHLAINEGIPLMKEGEDNENIFRRPISLRVLHGDFGPARPPDQPMQQDFDKAFWVSTKQNGIFQTWAPRWTMFSRGNIKEKARLLAFHQDNQQPGLQHRVWSKKKITDTCAVDLYAGIGYFVFSYAKLGMRVFCWELNPWSVEGLRRGAMRNRWSVKVVRGEDLNQATPELLQSGETIVVFLEDNQRAGARFAELADADMAIEVSHVNCGFLPSSRSTWEAAHAMVAESCEGWLHLHENVAAEDIDRRSGEVQQILRCRDNGNRGPRELTLEHCERVKTYAPGVWHCVFDVYVTRSRS